MRISHAFLYNGNTLQPGWYINST